MDRYCGGRLCYKCGKCCDWYYSSYNASDGPWIRNWRYWDREDWRRWEVNRFWYNFERRPNSKCHYGPFDPHCHYTGLIYRDLGCATCLCDTNFETKRRIEPITTHTTRVHVYSNY